MTIDEAIKDYEELFNAHKDKLPKVSTIDSPKMEYHVMADAVFWEDEGIDNEDELNLENPFRSVIHYRTSLLTGQGEPNELSERVYALAKRYFPNWIGFQENRCTFNAELADRIARIRKVSDWRIDKFFEDAME